MTAPLSVWEDVFVPPVEQVDPTAADSDFVFVGYLDFTGSLEIPEGVTSIGSNAFWGLSSLNSLTLEVILPNSVTSIGYGAFNECGKVILAVVQGSYAEEYAKENGIAHALSI